MFTTPDCAWPYSALNAPVNNSICCILMFYAEHKAQPEVFSSILTTLWWAVAAVTKVGFGRPHPVTGLGRVIASIVGIIGIAVLAVPISVISAAFLNEFSKLKKD